MSEPFVLYQDASLQTPCAEQPVHDPEAYKLPARQVYVGCADPSVRICTDTASVKH